MKGFLAYILESLRETLSLCYQKLTNHSRSESQNVEEDDDEERFLGI
jgi:hypothetical protein|tara:strand:+ start:191 stop:331 length:141 start_codon:yes stop_codon:yes gene_type:complete